MTGKAVVSSGRCGGAIAWGSDHKRHQGKKEETAICPGLLVASLPQVRQGTDSGSKETQQVETQQHARP